MVIVDGLLVFMFDKVGIAAIAVSQFFFWIQADCVRKVGNRLVRITLPGIGATAENVDGGLLWVDSKRRGEILNCLVSLILLKIVSAEPKINFTPVRAIAQPGDDAIIK